MSKMNLSYLVLTQIQDPHVKVCPMITCNKKTQCYLSKAMPHGTLRIILCCENLYVHTARVKPVLETCGWIRELPMNEVSTPGSLMVESGLWVRLSLKFNTGTAGLLGVLGLLPGPSRIISGKLRLFSRARLITHERIMHDDKSTPLLIQDGRF